MMKLMIIVMSMSYGTMVYSIYLYDMKECCTHVYVSYIDDDDDEMMITMMMIDR
jgi:hypothetical protein